MDCAHAVRDARLRDLRLQPELATPAMAQWASYLRGQADALGLEILDTTELTVAAGVARLRALIGALAAV